MRFKSFSREIDYDKAIAYDLALIADLENIAARGWFKAEGSSYSFGLIDLFMVDREKARAFDVSDEDLESYAHIADYSDEGLALYGFTRDELPSGWYVRGEALAKKAEGATSWAADLPTAEQHAKALKHAKTSLARHRRNQKKFGA